MSILRLQACGESQPTPEGPRLSTYYKTSRGEVCRECGINYQYQSPDRPLAGSCSWRPHTFARAKKRSWPNANNEVSHASVSSLVAFVRSRHATGGERACCVTRPNNGSEGDNSECCTNAVYFAYNYLDNKDNRPQKTCAWVCFEWIERAFFRSSLKDVFVGIFWNVIIFFLYKNANIKYLVAHPNPQNACMRCMPMFTLFVAKRRRISFYCVVLCNAWCD